MKKKKVVATLAACGLAMTLMVGGTLAYLTDTEKTTNTFTVGKVTVDLLEPNYPGNGSDQVTDVVPNEEIKKDPQIKNTGKNSTVVFTRVNIPMKKVITADESGKRLNNGEKKNTELFLFKNNQNGGYNSINDNWIELSKIYLDANGNVTDEANATMASYLYGYKHVLGVDKTTDPVFSVVKYANIIEGQDDDATENIDIYSYAIQADNITGITASTDGTTSFSYTQDMDKDTMSKIYTVYVNQTDNVDGTGKYDIKADKKGDNRIADADKTPNQTLHNATLNVTMTVANTHLKLNTGKTEDTKTKATAKVAYTGSGTAPSVTYSSSDTSVAEVDTSGNITAKKVGTCVITASAMNPDNGSVASATTTIQVTDQNSTN